jgi:ankyrin repeat protein
MPSRSLPTRSLRAQPDLDQLKRQAKDLLAAFRSGQPEITAEVTAHYRGADPATFALHDAQLVVARAYGFESWPRLKAYVDGVTVAGLADAVRAGDIGKVRAMLAARPELAHMDMAEHNEHRALHYAVLDRNPEMVRVLMEHGADPFKGIWPHRDATGALTIATDRGYDEIVAIINEALQRRSAEEAAQRPNRAGDVPNVVGTNANHEATVAAIANGDADWLRARHAEGTLTDPPGSYGLVTRAVIGNRADMLTLLLDLGRDPDERRRLDDLDDIVYTWGEPLRACAIAGKPELAEILLQRGADPNPSIYAASTPMFEAYQRGNQDIIAVLERHGGFADALVAGYFGLIEEARRMLADEAAGRLRPRTVPDGGTVAPRLLDCGADGGRPDIVRLALEHLDWPPGDARWHWNLMRPLGTHGEGDRGRYLECFQLMVDRAGGEAPGPSGRTILHDICAGWPRKTMTAEERLALATIVLDAGARLDRRDDLLKSTPLGWASRWGRLELVTLFLERGADRIEADAEPWATPRAWAQKMKHAAVLAVLS